MDQAIQTAYAKSFRGRLHAIATGRYVPLRLSKTHDRWNWGIAPQYDWLMAGGEEQSIHLDFAFDSQAHDRLHYHISLSGSAHPPKMLGLSLNDYWASARERRPVVLRVPPPRVLLLGIGHAHGEARKALQLPPVNAASKVTWHISCGFNSLRILNGTNYGKQS